MICSAQWEDGASPSDSELGNPLMLLASTQPGGSAASSEGSSLGGSPYAASQDFSLDLHYPTHSLRIRTPSLTGISSWSTSTSGQAEATTPAKQLKFGAGLGSWASFLGKRGVISLAVCALLLVSCTSIGLSSLGLHPHWLGGRKPLPRNSLISVGTDSGSMFGYLHFQMDCPAVHLGLDDDEPEDGGAYVPTTLFPLSSTLPKGISAVSSDDYHEITLLVGILSSCKAAKERLAVRSTWMRLAVPEGTTWRAVFLLTKSCEDQLKAESKEHGDLLFVDAEESYYALTPKVTEFFKYANEVGARYVMKTDDDTFVFIDRLLNELQSVAHDSCLYWGGSEQLPDMQHYNGSGIAVPLNKWYIDEEHYRTLAGTRYMAGGGYILSRDLVQRIVEQMGHLHMADQLPEDASVGRLLGDEVYNQCHCADTRHAKHIINFQGIELFHEGVFECERQDVARRVVTMHGFKNSTQMDMMLRYATNEYDLECDVTERDFKAVGTNMYWGRQVTPKAWAKDSIMTTWQLATALKFPTDPHTVLKHEQFVSFRNAWGPKLESTEEKEQYLNMLSNNRKNLVPLTDILAAEADGKLEVPWCTRVAWATQMIGMAAEMVDLHMLICDLNLSHYFVDTKTLHMNIHQGQVRMSYSTSRFHADSVCFSDIQCQACYPSSTSWLPNNKCDTRRGKCMGFDAYTQTRVIVHDFLLPHILPQGWMGPAEADHAEIGLRLNAAIEDVANLTNVNLNDVRVPSHASPQMWRRYETVFTLAQEPEVGQCLADTKEGTSAELQMLEARFMRRK